MKSRDFKAKDTELWLAEVKNGQFRKCWFICLKKESANWNEKKNGSGTKKWVEMTIFFAIQKCFIRLLLHDVRKEATKNWNEKNDVYSRSS
jgi:hypothetical protein